MQKLVELIQNAENQCCHDCGGPLRIPSVYIRHTCVGYIVISTEGSEYAICEECQTEYESNNLRVRYHEIVAARKFELLKPLCKTMEGLRQHFIPLNKLANLLGTKKRKVSLPRLLNLIHHIKLSKFDITQNPKDSKHRQPYFLKKSVESYIKKNYGDIDLNYLAVHNTLDNLKLVKDSL